MMPPIAGSMRAASWALTGSTSLSAWWFISSPQCLQIIFLLPLAMASSGLVEGNVVAPMAQCPGHPHQLLQELVGAAHVGFVQQLAGGIEDLADVAEVDVPEDGHQPQLAQHRKEVLDDAC